MIRITYTFLCRFCSETKSDTFTVASIYREEIPYPGLPNGWMMIDRQAVCPNHELKVNTHTGIVVENVRKRHKGGREKRAT